MTAQPVDTITTQFHAIEVEQALLGAIMSNNNATAMVAGIVSPEHFAEPLHSRIYSTILSLQAQNLPANVATLAVHFRNDPTMIEIGGTSYLARLMGSASTVVAAPDYARKIVDVWVTRESLKLIDDLRMGLASASYDDNGVDVLQQHLAKIAAVSESRHASARKNIRVVGSEIVEDVNRHFIGETETSAGVPTGSAELKRWIGQWEYQNLYILAGRPSMGKTSVATSLALKAAAQGANVLIFSLEMNKKQLGYRMLSDLTWSHGKGVPYERIKKRKISQSEFETVIDANRSLSALSIVVDDRAGLTVDQIASAATAESQRLKAQGKHLDMVLIDHGGLIKLPGRNTNKVNEIEDMTSTLKGIAKSLNTAVLCLNQLSRGVEGRDNKRPTLADLRGSGSWEQDADVVIFIYRESYYLERTKHDDMAKESKRLLRLEQVKNVVELAFDKNREGPCGVAEFMIDMGCSALRDLEVRHG